MLCLYGIFLQGYKGTLSSVLLCSNQILCYFVTYSSKGPMNTLEYNNEYKVKNNHNSLYQELSLSPPHIPHTRTYTIAPCPHKSPLTLILC